MIPFNKPFLTGKESDYILQSVHTGHISGDGIFTNRCHDFFIKKYGFHKVLLTTSCTDALEMSAILLNIEAGDEVIVPSYTFVSTANAFVLRGAKIVFADSNELNPNIDASKLENLITKKTKAIVVVHYAGIACEMDKILSLANKYNLKVIEDAAQAIDSYYINKHGEKQVLGKIGSLGTFSFHETKNVISGEGGLLAINDQDFIERAEIIREKGTNRSAFFRGEIDKYGWVDIGSSFLPSDIIAAFLFAQLEHLDEIQRKRKILWDTYLSNLLELEKLTYIRLPQLPSFATNNAHMFYIICRSLEERASLIQYLRKKGVYSVFHYLSLHKSGFFTSKHDGRDLPWADYYTDRLLRLPMFYELDINTVEIISNYIVDFYKNTRH